MSYIVKNTSVKSADVKWFSELHPEVVKRINDFVKSFPGVLGYQTIVINDNCLEKIYDFKDIDTFKAYRVAAKQNPDFIQRKQYNDANGILTFSEKFDSDAQPK